MNFGDYELLDLLGRDAGGETWRAHDPRTGRVVALRLLPSEWAADSEVARRVLGQVRAAAALNNPHVVPVHDFGQIGGRLFVDMRLIDGTELRSMLRAGPLSSDHAASIVEQVASALDSAHRAGLVHGRVRPPNILVTAAGFAYLADLGIGPVEASMASSWPYLAPERFGAAELDAASDVYSLTCVLVECLTGAPPFAGDTVQALAVAHRSTPPPRASVSQAVPADFDDVIARGMAKNPAHRYRSATDLAAAARAAVGVAAQPAQPVLPMPPQSARPAPPRRRRSVLIGILCAAIVIALCVMIGVVATGTDTAASERGEDMAPPSQTSQEPAPTTYGPQVALPFTSLNGPQGLALAADGDILVADMNNVRVVRLAPATGVQTTLPFTGLTQPVDVAVDRAGNVFVADFADSMILRLQADTAVQSQVPLVNLIHNSSVVVDDSGNVYAEGFKIFDMVMVPGGNGPEKVVPFDGINLGDFDVDSLGDVYAIDISKNRVVRLDADWRTQTVLPFSDIDPNSIAVGGDGSVYVTDITNRSVSKWTPGTKSPVILPFTGLVKPTGIAVDTAGNVYVSDLDQNDVLKLPMI